MSEAKRLLEQATPLPWRIVADDIGPIVPRYATKPDAALIVYATNHLPAFLELYEEAATVVNLDESFGPDGSSRFPALAKAVEALRELDE